MTENELIDEIRDYVHNIHTAEPFHGFSFRELREVGEHFALPREKRIAELEKENERLTVSYETLKLHDEEEIGMLKSENAELKLKLEALEGQTPWKDIKDKSELIKENAQLKSNRDYWRESSIYWHKQLKNKKYRKIAKATQQQLTKAKNILNNFLNACEDYEISEARAEAEQFLKNDSCPDVMCEDCTKEDCGTRQLGLVGKVK